MNKKYYKSIVGCFAAGLVLLLVSCNPASKYEKAEKESIQNYLSSNSADTFDLKPSGLYYHNILTGPGRTPVIHDTAYVQYTGMYLDGTVFTSTTGSPDQAFPVAEGFLIAGFDEGITYMKEGGKARFLIPSSLAYGPGGYYSIPGYTPLLYDVTLVKVSPGPAK
jgi:FKBP-type peptidyl-prolyl cis-trans isomerase